jgi:[ribosomal protein S5]-alanine N-acetyltransferase
MTVDDAFHSFPTLTTERLRLRAPRLTDAPAVLAWKSDAEVTLPYGQEPYIALNQAEAWVEGRLVDFERRDALVWILARAEDDSPVGMACLWHLDTTSRCAEIGYELDRSTWGQGLATEALRAVLRFGFSIMELNRVEASPLAPNGPSRRLLLKLGFRLEGTLRQRILVRDRFEDQLFFGLLRTEWKALSRAAARTRALDILDVESTGH